MRVYLGVYIYIYIHSNVCFLLDFTLDWARSCLIEDQKV